MLRLHIAPLVSLLLVSRHYFWNIFFSVVVPIYVEEEVEIKPAITIVEECPHKEEVVQIVKIDEVAGNHQHGPDHVHHDDEEKFSPRFGGWLGFNKKQSALGSTCKITSGWSCPRSGRYPHPVDCQKYVQCNFKRENTVYECSENQAYDTRSRGCSSDWSSCEALTECLYNHELLEDPSNAQNYFICVKQETILKQPRYSAYRRHCADGRVFDLDYQRCITHKELLTTSALDPYKHPIKARPPSSHHKKKSPDQKKKADKKKMDKKKKDKKKTNKKKMDKKKTDKRKTDTKKPVKNKKPVENKKKVVKNKKKKDSSKIKKKQSKSQDDLWSR